MGSELTFSIGAEGPGAEKDKDGHPEDLHDGGRTEECGQSGDGASEPTAAGLLLGSALSSRFCRRPWAGGT